VSFIVIVPARLASTRLPRKPLADLGGAPMVVRVAQRALASHAERVVVAADDTEVVAACRSHGVDAVLTSPTHETGTDRLAEAAAVLGLAAEQIVVNVQGDEPLLPPEVIDTVAAALEQHADCDIATAAHPIIDAAEFFNPNVVKVVTDREGRAPPCPSNCRHGATLGSTPTGFASCSAFRSWNPMRWRPRSGSSSCARWRTDSA
jgi:3-deoxy-manno-octulosonate cytidylyltransferase (CMP-KDO synthetase)